LRPAGPAVKAKGGPNRADPVIAKPEKPRETRAMQSPLLRRALLVCGLELGVSGPVVRAQGAAPPRQLWLYAAQNLWVEANVSALEQLLARAGAAGYTHVLLADSKFARLGDMDARYFAHLERVKHAAADHGLEIVPALFNLGYSNDLLWHDPNLIEGLPVTNALFVVQGGEARLVPDPPVAFPDGDFEDLSRWSWKDETVAPDHGTARVSDPAGRNARIVARLAVRPFRQYHIRVRVKTQEFRGTPEVKVLADGRELNFNYLQVKPTQDWQTHHAVFNSLDHAEVAVYFGCWDGRTGTLWWDDAHIEEIGLLNVIRRDGAPLEVRTEAGEVLVEGRDFEPVRDPRMGNQPWNGAYEVFHEPPVLRVHRPDGTRLRVSYYHAVTIHDGQAMICPSEPRTLALLRDQARRLHAAWGARGYLMSHDEIRVLNWCAACRRRGLDAGALLADNVRACIQILREVNPGGRIYVWSDMFDPHHNARPNYYLVRGDLRGSWAGLDAEVIVVPWYFERRAESLAWFAGRGHRQVIAAYYDAAPERVRDWLAAARAHAGIEGVMYTTWQQRYADLERFAALVRGARP